MSILTHFQHLSLSPDQEQALQGVDQFLASNAEVFILKGYAGTGKTTILKGIIDFLKDQKKQVEVMAPTGRAAKVLRDKTGFGQTIHKTIYNFKELKTTEDDGDDAGSSFHYFFPIHQIEDNETVLIIDEASMVSSKESHHELFTFGTGILLDDLITNSRIPFSKCKLILVGDPAQLPPVGDNQSLALSEEYFESLGFKTASATLTTVKRQNQNSILENAFRIRSLIGNKQKPSFQFLFDQTNSFEIPTDHVPHQYVREFPIPEIGNGVIIAYSNSQCHQYNFAVREKLFPGKHTVQAGDVLMINHNNYHTYGVEMMNGEMAKVIGVNSSLIERKNIPVFDVIAGKRVKKHVTLGFREVTIRLGGHSEDVKCLIIDSLLNSPNRDLHILELKALYVDFVMRFKEEQEKNKQQGRMSLRVGSTEFKDRLKSDRFFNAVRVKYGYAITCHKAQGGEWDTVFVDYYGRTSLADDPLRWSYTATTRARSKFFAANAPLITPFSKFKINSIGHLTHVPENALSLGLVPLSPYHRENQPPAKSLKFWELQEKFENSAYQITQVQSMGEYRERYTIQREDELLVIESDHNKAGIFKDFQPVPGSATAWKDDLLDLVHQPYQAVYSIDYSPSSESLKRLWGTMRQATEEFEVTITNVEEKLQQYFVSYFLKTDGKAALIQFYFNGKGQLTSALPKSTEGPNDLKLAQLIQKLQEYAS
ncbi:UvrD-like helicase C-terminal domain-containing protein [Algoriphagus alkaliphilus]|uniref:UvrD-like helicase C-terminal domain-containing protein n=1 Tax=Algoriphagus alkaliphilus TaxID=279824 RepID=A0A1G5ZN08_9BACT|nr:AAA family ATPase [Algoriphagus alkaliphilus]SDA95980.1 UvrD-like helicase C-terminal domain-containing protein [Algoriphagus alkaliphilus]